MPHLVVYIASDDSGGDSGDDSGGDSGDDSGGDDSGGSDISHCLC